MGIDARNVSYIFRLDDVWSSRIVRNVTRSSAHRTEGATATMDAARGALRVGCDRSDGGGSQWTRWSWGRWKRREDALVHECELSKRHAGAGGGNLVSEAGVAVLGLEDVERTLFDNVEVVSDVALLDDDLALGDLDLLHGRQDVRRLVVVEVAEQKVGRDREADPGELLR